MKQFIAGLFAILLSCTSFSQINCTEFPVDITIQSYWDGFDNCVCYIDYHTNNDAFDAAFIFQTSNDDIQWVDRFQIHVDDFNYGVVQDSCMDIPVPCTWWRVGQLLVSGDTCWSESINSCDFNQTMCGIVVGIDEAYPLTDVLLRSLPDGIEPLVYNMAGQLVDHTYHGIIVEVLYWENRTYIRKRIQKGL